MRKGRGAAIWIAAAALGMAAGAAPSAQRPADLTLPATSVGEVVAFANEYVRVRYAVLEYPPAERRVAEARPIAVYISIEPESGGAKTRLLELPRGGHKSWRTGVVPRGVTIEILKPPPPLSFLGEPGTDPPRGSEAEELWPGGRLVLATFESMHFAEGTGRYPSVTIFLSDGVVEVAHGGARRRVGVRAGDAFWFEATTRITVVSDNPVGAAIVQLYPDR